MCKACWDPIARKFPSTYEDELFSRLDWEERERRHAQYEVELGLDLIESHCISHLSGWVSFILSCIVVAMSVTSEGAHSGPHR